METFRLIASVWGIFGILLVIGWLRMDIEGKLAEGKEIVPAWLPVAAIAAVAATLAILLWDVWWR